MAELKPYKKVLVENMCAVCAIYEPNPFRNSIIEEAIKESVHTPSGSTGIADDAWCWVYYDWCGNPVGLTSEMPEGVIVEKFTEENIGSKSLADYLNHENPKAIEAWNRRYTPSEIEITPFEVGNTIRISLPKDKKIMNYQGEEIDFDYGAED